MIVNNFDTKTDFFKANPQLNIETFKKVSSNVMWAIALLYDTKSKFFNLPIDDRLNIIKKEFLKDKDFNIEKYKNQIELYVKLTTTPAKRQLIQWNRILDEKSKYLETIRYSSETYNDIEKMLSSNTKLYEELSRITSAIEMEEAGSAVKGGAKKSLLEDDNLTDNNDTI